MKNESYYTLRRAKLKQTVEDLITDLPLAEQARLLNDIVSDSIVSRYQDKLRILIFAEQCSLDFRSSVNYKLQLTRPNRQTKLKPKSSTPPPTLADLGLDL